MQRRMYRVSDTSDRDPSLQIGIRQRIERMTRILQPLSQWLASFSPSEVRKPVNRGVKLPASCQAIVATELDGTEHAPDPRTPDIEHWAVSPDHGPRTVKA